MKRRLVPYNEEILLISGPVPAIGLQLQVKVVYHVSKYEA